MRGEEEERRGDRGGGGGCYHSGDESPSRHATDSSHNRFDRFRSTQVAIHVFVVRHFSEAKNSSFLIKFHTIQQAPLQFILFGDNQNRIALLLAGK